MPGPPPDAATASVPTVHASGGGGSGAGGSGKKGKRGKGKRKAKKGKGKESTKGGKKKAAGKKGKGGKGCGDPVCPITGRVFVDFLDFGFGGPLPLTWERHYDSRESDGAADLGHGWSHPYGWHVIVHRRSAMVVDETGGEQEFGAVPEDGSEVVNGFAWGLRREGDGLALRLPELERVYRFGPADARGVHWLVAIDDLNHNRISIQRGPRGEMIGLVDSAGRPYRVTSDRSGRIASIAVAVDATHQQWMTLTEYAYDDKGDLVSFTDAEGFVWRYAYDNHLLVEHRLATGLSYCYRYDGRSAGAYCVETWGEYIGYQDPALETPLPPRPAQGRDTRKVKGINYVRFEYLKDQNYCEAENGLGGVEKFFGDEAGRVIKYVRENGGVIETFYDDDTGGMTSHTDEYGAACTVEPDEDGNPGAHREPNGKGVLRYIDDDGFGTEVTFDERTLGVSYKRFDRHRNLVWMQHVDGTVEEWTYDSRGLMLSFTTRAGVMLQYEHDDMGNCLSTAWPDGSVETMEYDYLGRRIAHTDPSSNRTEWLYDRRSEIVWKRHADGTEIRVTRNAMRRATVVDEAGRMTRYEYGGLDWVMGIVFPDGRTVAQRWDVEGNLIAVWNARGQVFRQEFDAARQWRGCRTFENLRHAAGWNLAGEPSWIESPNGRDVCIRDAEGDLIGAEMSDGQTITVEYASAGPVKIDNGVAVIEREYDIAGNVTLDRQGAHHLALSWVGGELAKLGGDVGVPLVLVRGRNAEVSRMIAGTTEVDLDRFSGKDLLTYFGDGLVMRRHHGPTGLLLVQSVARRSPTVPDHEAATSADPNLLLWTRYEYDAWQMLRSEQRSDGTTTEYELTTGGQIAVRRVSRGGRVIEEERIAYDAAGTPMLPGVRFDALMRPVGVAGETFEYDDAGRLARRVTDAGIWEYQWDAADSLVRVVAPDHVVELDYDARGRRTGKRVFRGDELTRRVSYVWSENQVLHEVDELAGSSRTYLWREGTYFLVGHVDVVGGQEQPCFYLTTPVGSVDTALAMDGNVVWSAERTAYGDYRPTRETVKVSARFQNQSYDEDVQLVYNRSRWYEPRVGMYVSPDPLLLGGTLNPRDYAGNPMFFSDPMGQAAKVPRKPSNNPSPGQPGGAPANHPDRPTTKPADTNAMNGAYMSQPGHWATNGEPGGPPGSIKCPVKSMNQSKGWGKSAGDPDHGPGSIRKQIDAAGRKYGCHSCGSKNPNGPGSKKRSGHFTPDHVPPASSYNKGQSRDKAALPAGTGPAHGSVRLYPQCKKCSNSQGPMTAAAPLSTIRKEQTKLNREMHASGM
jgi:RHS repeat-associated protein